MLDCKCIPSAFGICTKSRLKPCLSAAKLCLGFINKAATVLKIAVKEQASSILKANVEVQTKCIALNLKAHSEGDLFTCIALHETLLVS